MYAALSVSKEGVLHESISMLVATCALGAFAS